MRIFYASHEAGDAAIAGSKTWTRNLLWALRDLGHDVVTFDFDLDAAAHHLDPSSPASAAFIAENRPLASEELLRQIRAAHHSQPIDLFFSYFYSANVEPAAIAEIRELGIVTANWFCNASYQLHLVQEIAPAYDFCLVPERDRLADYRDLGANPIYCQEAANPTVYRPYAELPQTYDLTFVGQRYGDRPAFVRAVADAGIDIQVWGNGWLELPPQTFKGRVRRRLRRMLRPSLSLPPEICHGPVDDQAYVEMYSRSRISLGFAKVAGALPDGRVVKQVRLRDFEAPMSGAFYLAEYSEELAAFFEPDREIVCFEDEIELVAKARFYLAHPVQRERIRFAGHERALREHTWQARLSTAFAAAGLPC
jgi:spore maturation protein CgeB